MKSIKINVVNSGKSEVCMTVEEQVILCTHPNGQHRMHAIIWRVRQTLKHPPLICAHGLTRRAFDFEVAAEKLSATRDVIALDMPGRGGSSWFEDKTLYNYPQYAADCFSVLAALGLKEVDWLGTSMGGLIGLMMAGTEYNPIRKLALNDVGPVIPYTALRRIAAYVSYTPRFPSLQEAERHCRAIYADFGIVGDEAWKRFTEITVKEDGQGGYVFHYDPGIAENIAAIKEDVNIWPDYDKIKIPLLILRGARSDVLSEDTAKEMCARHKGAQLISFEGCGHAPALQSAAQIKALEDFFV